MALASPAMAQDSGTNAANLQTISLSAVVTPGAQPLMDTEFTVTPLGAGSVGPVVARSQDGPAVIQLPAGRYRVVAAYGSATAQSDFLVDTAPVVHQVNLNAGSVVLKLIKHVGGPTLKNVAWEILTYGKDAQGKRHHITSAAAAQPRFTLPEGFYLARATHGTQEVRHTIEISPGVTYKYTVILQ